MRLDHLLSREPILLGSNHGVRPVGGAWFVFLCSHVFTARQWVVGVGAFFGLGIKRFMRTSTLSGSRSTPCERPPLCGGCPHARPEGFVSWVLGVCGGLFVICIVVASIFVLYCFLCFV